MINTTFPTMTLQDPAILVVDDVLALSANIEQIKEIANECCKWTRENCLRWNLEKSQILRMILQIRGEQNAV